MSSRKPSQRNNLVALGSAAVLAVYAAGFARTRSAAQLFASEAAERRPTLPTPQLPTVGVEPAHDSIGRAVIASPPSKQAAKPASTLLPEKVNTVVRPESAKSAPESVVALLPVPTVVAPATPAPVPLVPIAAPPAVTPVISDSARARASQSAADSAIAAALRGKYAKDGVFRGYGTSRHGDIEAELEIKDGWITAAKISQCRTQYSCSWIAALPPQVLARQSANVDFVSGATQSTNAFYYAVLEALSKAK